MDDLVLSVFGVHMDAGSREAHIMESLEHILQHARPFLAVFCQYRPAGRICCLAYMSIEPSRAACSSICSFDNILDAW